MKIKSLLGMLLLFMVGQAYAARIDTIMVKSDKMGRSIEVVTVTPNKIGKFPTVYMLNGFTGSCHTWLNVNRGLVEKAENDGIVIVCPSGEDSWFWDSETNKGLQFETFVSKELVEYIDANYPTIADRKARAITGLSMGGHGALWLSIRHKDIFGACGSTSGGVDLRPFPNSWNLKELLGSLKENPTVWDEHIVINQLDKLKNGDLAIIFDCGTKDFFYKVNLQLHDELVKRGIFHDFISRPGDHNSTYWRNSIEYHWLFFNKFFKGYRTKGE